MHFLRGRTRPTTAGWKKRMKKKTFGTRKWAADFNKSGGIEEAEAVERRDKLIRSADRKTGRVLIFTVSPSSLRVCVLKRRCSTFNGLSAWITSTNVLEKNGAQLETSPRAAREDLKRVPDLKKNRCGSKNHGSSSVRRQTFSSSSSSSRI